jgi:hypothetical protein
VWRADPSAGAGPAGTSASRSAGDRTRRTGRRIRRGSRSAPAGPGHADGAFSAAYRSISACCRSKTLVSSTPLTDSLSWVIAVMSATDRCVAPATRRRTRPTRTCSRTNSGSRTTATNVSRHDRTSIATSALTTVTALPRIELAVSVTTDCTPATSLPSRLWISPVRGSSPLRRAGGRGHHGGAGCHGRRVFRARPEVQPLIPVRVRLRRTREGDRTPHRCLDNR